MQASAMSAQHLAPSSQSTAPALALATLKRSLGEFQKTFGSNRWQRPKKFSGKVEQKLLEDIRDAARAHYGIPNLEIELDLQAQVLKLLSVYKGRQIAILFSPWAPEGYRDNKVLGTRFLRTLPSLSAQELPFHPRNHAVGLSRRELVLGALAIAAGSLGLYSLKTWLLEQAATYGPGDVVMILGYHTDVSEAARTYKVIKDVVAAVPKYEDGKPKAICVAEHIPGAQRVLDRLLQMYPEYAVLSRAQMLNDSDFYPRLRKVYEMTLKKDLQTLAKRRKEADPDPQKSKSVGTFFDAVLKQMDVPVETENAPWESFKATFPTDILPVDEFMQEKDFEGYWKWNRTAVEAELEAVPLREKEFAKLLENLRQKYPDRVLFAIRGGAHQFFTSAFQGRGYRFQAIKAFPEDLESASYWMSKIWRTKKPVAESEQKEIVLRYLARKNLEHALQSRGVTTQGCIDLADKAIRLLESREGGLESWLRKHFEAASGEADLSTRLLNDSLERGVLRMDLSNPQSPKILVGGAVGKAAVPAAPKAPEPVSEEEQLAVEFIKKHEDYLGPLWRNKALQKVSEEVLTPEAWQQIKEALGNTHVRIGPDAFPLSLRLVNGFEKLANRRTAEVRDLTGRKYGEYLAIIWSLYARSRLDFAWEKKESPTDQAMRRQMTEDLEHYRRVVTGVMMHLIPKVREAKKLTLADLPVLRVDGREIHPSADQQGAQEEIMYEVHFYSEVSKDMKPPSLTFHISRSDGLAEKADVQLGAEITDQLFAGIDRWENLSTTIPAKKALLHETGKLGLKGLEERALAVSFLVDAADKDTADELADVLLEERSPTMRSLMIWAILRLVCAADSVSPELLSKLERAKVLAGEPAWASAASLKMLKDFLSEMGTAQKVQEALSTRITSGYDAAKPEVTAEIAKTQAALEILRTPGAHTERQLLEEATFLAKDGPREIVLDLLRLFPQQKSQEVRALLLKGVMRIGDTDERLFDPMRLELRALENSLYDEGYWHEVSRDGIRNLQIVFMELDGKRVFSGMVEEVLRDGQSSRLRDWLMPIIARFADPANDSKPEYFQAWVRLTDLPKKVRADMAKQPKPDFAINQDDLKALMKKPSEQVAEEKVEAKASEDPPARVLLYLVNRVALIPHPATRDILLEFLKDSSPEVRKTTIDHLANYADTKTRKALKLVAGQDTDPSVRSSAQAALAKIKRAGEIRDELINTAMDIEGKTPAVRKEALRKIEWYASDSVIDFLLHIEEPEIRVDDAVLSAESKAAKLEDRQKEEDGVRAQALYAVRTIINLPEFAHVARQKWFKEELEGWLYERVADKKVPIKRYGKWIIPLLKIFENIGDEKTVEAIDVAIAGMPAEETRYLNGLYRAKRRIQTGFRKEVSEVPPTFYPEARLEKLRSTLSMYSVIPKTILELMEILRDLKASSYLQGKDIFANEVVHKTPLEKAFMQIARAKLYHELARETLKAKEGAKMIREKVLASVQWESLRDGMLKVFPNMAVLDEESLAREAVAHLMSLQYEGAEYGDEIGADLAQALNLLKNDIHADPYFQTITSGIEANGDIVAQVKEFALLKGSLTQKEREPIVALQAEGNSIRTRLARVFKEVKANIHKWLGFDIQQLILEGEIEAARKKIDEGREFGLNINQIAELEGMFADQAVSEPVEAGESPSIEASA